MFGEVTGYAPRLRTFGVIGFGRYAHTHATGHSGVSLATGFAPRKAELSLHAGPSGFRGNPGPPRAASDRQGCPCIRHLDPVDEGALGELIAAGLVRLKALWPVTPWKLDKGHGL